MVLVSSVIEKVTVYRSGATVHRRLEVEAADGVFPERIAVAELPLALLDASVKIAVVSANGSPDVPIVTGVRVGLYVAPRAELPEPPDDEEIRRLERTIEKKNVELGDLELEGSVLEALRVPERPEPEEGKAPPPSPMAARVLLEEMVNEGALRRRERSRTIRTEIDQLDRERRALVARRDEASKARRIDAKEITKTVVARLSGGAGLETVTLRLDYFVPGARWAPSYQVRLARDATSAEIVQRALICQRTGEDWSGVHLALSTATPMSWTELPELAAVRIGKRQATPPKTRGFRPPPTGASQLYADYDGARANVGRLVPPKPVPSIPASSIRAPGPMSIGGPGNRSEIAVGAMYAGSGAPNDIADAMSYEVEGADEDDFAPAEESVMPPPSMKMASLAAPAPPAPAREMPKRRSRREKEIAPLGAPASVLEAVVYTQLVLGPPSDPSLRGRLMPVDRKAAYLETLNIGGRHLDLDVLDLVDQAASRAQRVTQETSLPRGAVDVARVSGSFDYTYTADATVDVRSDGVFHSVPLGTRTAPCDVKYVVVPREDTNVFRIARIENPLYAPLLAGPAELYVGGEYVLTTSIESVPARGKLTLGLGVEQAIRCARNTRYAEKRTSDKVVATNELCHDIEIEIVNNLPRAASCEVRERVPHPAEDAEVVIDEHDVTPPWTPYDQEERGALVLGGRCWMVDVPAGGQTKLTARYVVKIYANNEIAGGNRREA